MRLAVWLALILVPWCSELSAQVRRKIPEPKIVREEVVTKDGLREWKKFEPKTCPACRGAKKTPCHNCTQFTQKPPPPKPKTCAECDNTHTAICRVCAGTGQTFDPLVEMICPYCSGSGWWICGLCHGNGSYPVKGGGKKDRSCGGCKKRGALPCLACRGKRHVPVVKVGRHGPGEASVKQLQKAREVVAEAFEKLKSFQPTSRESKTMKELSKIVDRAARVVPAIKGGKATLKEGLKAVGRGSAYVGYQDWVVNEFVRFQDRTIYLLWYQLKLLDLCIKHAEHNEKAEAAARHK